MLAAWLSYWLAQLAWPVSGYLITTAILYAFVAKSKNPWGQAAKSTLGPAIVGFGLLTVALLWINLFIPPADQRAVQHITAFESFLARLSNVLPAWSKLNWWKLVLALGLLVIANRVVPSLRLVTRFVFIKKALKRATTVLTTVTSFSFFTNDAILAVQARDVATHASIVWAQSRSNEQKQLARYLAARVTTATIRALPSSQTQYAREIGRYVATLDALSDDGKRDLAVALSESDVTGASSESGNRTTVQRPAKDEFLRDPATTLSDQARKEEAATKLADEEEKRAVEEILKATRDAGTDKAKELARLVIESAFTLAPPAFIGEAGAYCDKVLDKYIERWTDPTVTRFSTKILGSLPRHPASSTRDAVASVKSAIAKKINAARDKARDATNTLVNAGSWAVTDDSTADDLLAARAGAAIREEAYASAEKLTDESRRLRDEYGPVAEQLGFGSVVRETDVALRENARPLEITGQRVQQQRVEAQQREFKRLTEERREFERKTETVRPEIK